MEKEEYEFYPTGCLRLGLPRNEDSHKLEVLLDEIKQHVLYRADGISIKIERTQGLPPEGGKALIQKVRIDTWDCVA